MITFKSPGDLAQLDPHDPAYPVMQELIQLLIDDFPIQPYNADDYGYLVLVEPGDTHRVLTELGMPWTLAEVPWEAASLRQGFFHLTYLGTDDFGIAFVVRDEPSIDAELREVLTEILDTTPQGEHA